MKEIDLLGYLIGFWVNRGAQNRENSTREISPDQQQLPEAISTRTITDIAFISVCRNIPLSLNFIQMPWGIEAAQIQDKLAMMSYLGYIRPNGSKFSWYFDKNLDWMRSRISKDDPKALIRINSTLEIISRYDDDELTKLVKVLSQRIMGEGTAKHPEAYNELSDVYQETIKQLVDQ